MRVWIPEQIAAESMRVQLALPLSFIVNKSSRPVPPPSLGANDASSDCKWQSGSSCLHPRSVRIFSTLCPLRRCGLYRFHIKQVKETVFLLMVLMFYQPWRCEFHSREFLSCFIWTLMSVKHGKKAYQSTSEGEIVSILFWTSESLPGRFSLSSIY